MAASGFLCTVPYLCTGSSVVMVQHSTLANIVYYKLSLHQLSLLFLNKIYDEEKLETTNLDKEKRDPQIGMPGQSG